MPSYHDYVTKLKFLFDPSPLNSTTYDYCSWFHHWYHIKTILDPLMKEPKIALDSLFDYMLKVMVVLLIVMMVIHGWRPKKRIQSMKLWGRIIVCVLCRSYLLLCCRLDSKMIVLGWTTERSWLQTLWPILQTIQHKTPRHIHIMTL